MRDGLQRAVARPARRGRELVHTDSLYAMHMTTGRWMPRKQGRRNAPLIAKLRALWRRVQRRRPGEVELRHVRSHIRVPGNELADWLADQGRSAFAQADMTDEADGWMTTWIRQHAATTRQPGAGGGTERPPGDG